MKRSIDFIITQNCNYRCPYCSQSKKFSDNRFDEAHDDTIEAFLNFIRLKGSDFEVTLSGGEPFCHPKFFYIANEIIKAKAKISVVSNFSYPFETYKKLKDLAGENLEEVLVSLHLSQIKDLEEFINKAVEFNKIKGNTKFTAVSVLSDDNLYQLKEIALRFQKEKINFELQHKRIKNSFVKYGKEAQEFIKQYPISKIKEKSGTYAKICNAGMDFMLVYQDGSCYRCYSSRFNKIHSMGNIKDKNFKMYKSPIPCLNKNCTCPKPIINGLIDYNRSNFLKASVLSLYNLLFIPYYLIKNRNILKAKIRQIIDLKK